jgi:hypothetical protein
MKATLRTLPFMLKFRKQIQKADFDLLLIMKQELNKEIERRKK